MSQHTDAVNTYLAPAQRSLRLNISWTFVGNALYAACQWGMLVVLAKLGSPEMVGRFAFALAVTAPVFMLTNLQLRAVEATDVTGQFAFGDYLALRILCTGLALAAIIGFAAFSHISLLITSVIVVVAIAKGAESISDAIYGLVQRNERMDLIARSMILKGVLSLAAFAVAIAMTGKLAWGTLALAGAWCVVLGTYDFGLARRFAGNSQWTEGRPAFAPRFEAGILARLARLSFPLGVTATLGSLVLVVPRYFVEHYAGARALGFFAAIAYLMVGGSLISNAIAQSATPRLASHHASGDGRAFRALLFRLCGTAAVPGIAGVLIAILAGKPVLRLLYRADYANYSDVFVLVMAATAIYCVTSILTNGLTAARTFKPQLALLSAVIVVSTAACFFWVPTHGLMGAALAVVLAAVTQFVGSLVVLLPVLLAPQDSASVLAEQGPRLDVFDNFPCWENGADLLKQQIRALRSKAVADIGGGANPLLDRAFIEESGVEYSLLDISETELNKAPDYSKKIQVDVAAPLNDFLSRVGEERFDLIFSHMFLEHVPHPLRVHRNIHASLKPGGLAIHFFASSNNFPLMINRLMPGWVTNILLRVAQPQRDLDGREKKFPTYYAMCGAPSKALKSKYRELGFDVVRHTGFIGHDYYKRVPVLRDIERRLRPILVAAGIPLISDSLLILRKSPVASSRGKVAHRRVPTVSVSQTRLRLVHKAEIPSPRAPLSR